MYAWRAISASAPAEHYLDLVGQLLVGRLSLAEWLLLAAQPGVVSTLRDMQYSAHDLHLKLCSMRTDEGEL
jgi:hypothetical protein